MHMTRHLLRGIHSIYPHHFVEQYPVGTTRYIDNILTTMLGSRQGVDPRFEGIITHRHLVLVVSQNNKRGTRYYSLTCSLCSPNLGLPKWKRMIRDSTWSRWRHTVALRIGKQTKTGMVCYNTLPAASFCGRLRSCTTFHSCGSQVNKKQTDMTMIENRIKNVGRQIIKFSISIISFVDNNS